MRKKNKNYIKIYEGNDKNCKVDNLKQDKNYEFRICSVYNNLLGNWSETQNITTKINFNSVILSESNRQKEFILKLKEWTDNSKMELIYRGSRDVTLSANFHNKCDNQGPTITLCKHENGYIFGGYCSVSWIKRQGYSSAPDSFLFTLTNMYNTEPTKFPLKNNDGSNGIWDSSYHCSIFGAGHDLYIQTDFVNQLSNTNFPYTYQDILGKGKSIFSGNTKNTEGNYSQFKLKEVEVFKIIKN